MNDPTVKLPVLSSTDRKSGRATFDNDGRSVWEWQVSTGVFTRTITEDQLTQLATTNLELVEGAAQAGRDGWLYETGEHPAKAHVAPTKSAARARSVTPARSSVGPVARLLKRFAGA